MSRAAGVVLAALLVGCGGESPLPVTTFEARPPLDAERFIEADDGTRLYYERLGEGPQTVVVPLAFFLRDTFVARPELVEGRTLVFYDPRDRGRSEAVEDLSRLSTPQDVADLERLREALDIDSMALIGFSRFGKVAALYALEHPERVTHVVQLGPSARDTEVIYPPHLRSADRVEAMGREQMFAVQKLQAEGYDRSHPRDYCEREWSVIRRALVGDPAAVAGLPSPCDLEREWPVHLQRHSAQLLLTESRADPGADRVATLEVPVLVIHGTRDRQAPYGAGRQWAYELPVARLLTLEGAAHCTWVEASERVFGAIDRFLDGEWPADAEVIERIDPRVDPDAEV